MIIKIIKRSFGVIFGLVCLGLITVTAAEVLSFKVIYDAGGIFLGFLCIILLSLLSSTFLSSSFEIPKWKAYSMRGGLFAVFVFYCLILLNLLFTSRHYLFEYAFTSNITQHIAIGTNFIPFHTILNYIKNSETFSPTILNANLLGNLLAFAPMGCFLPVLFPKLKKYVSFVYVLFFTILVIELAQFITNLGILDIDDMILNLTGASIAFFLFRLPFFQNLYQKLHWI